ncbi:hypothetical protein R83H12_00188 [Fibrobacteria bacterium R8-3-H12]
MKNINSLLVVFALAFTISCGENTSSSYNAEGSSSSSGDSSSSSIYDGSSSSSNSGGSSSSGDLSSSSIYDGSSSSNSDGSSSSGDSSSSSTSIDDVSSSSSNSGNSSSSGSNACVTWGNWIQTTAPTCDAAGTETRTCTSDPSKTETREKAKLVWGEWAQTTAPTCDEAGMETRTCASEPSKTETREIAQLVWGPWVEITAATSTEHAKGKETCPNGEEKFSDLAVCGGVEYAEAYQRCGTGNVIETKCGATGWYDASNLNLNCQSNVVVNKCGSGWVNPSTQFCQLGTNTVQSLCNGQTFTSNQRCTSNVIETKCGSSWYDASNLNLDCQSNVVVNKCGSGWVNPSTQFCQLGTNTVQSLCNGQTFTSNQRCTSNVIETKCGSSWYDASNLNLDCQSNVIVNKCGNGWYNPSTQFCDNRNGGNIYKFVTIGTGATAQTWMAENLNYNVEGSKCYGESGLVWTEDEKTIVLSTAEVQANCAKYGRLYNWSTAMANCPSGWHLPSYAEWDALIISVEPDCLNNAQCRLGAGTKLKAASNWEPFSGIPTGTDTFGFAALPGGIGDNSENEFYNVGEYGAWWSATPNGSSNAYMRIMYHDEIYVGGGGQQQ